MLILWCQGRGLSQILGMLNVDTWGSVWGVGTYIGDVNIGGSGGGFRDRYGWGVLGQIFEMLIL